MRQTDVHGWEVPTEGDSDYVEIFNNLIDGIDHDALLTVDTLPSSHLEGRWLINSSDQTVYYDDGSNFVKVDPERQFPDSIAARVNEDENIGAEWTFEQSIDTDIDGRAEYVEQVDEAEESQDAESINEYTENQLAQKGSAITVSGSWKFQEKIVLESMLIENDTLGVPRHG